MKKRDGGRKLSKKEWTAREEVLRTQLLRCQSEVMEKEIAVVILLNALHPDPANEVFNALFKWLSLIHI